MKGHKRPTSFQLFRRYIMKHLLILIIMTLSTASFAAATKTEIIEEEVCHAVAGCWVNPKNGECPDCVIETRTIVTVIEEEIPILKKEIEPIVKESIVKTKNISSSHYINHYRRASSKDIKRWKKANRPNWTCVVGTCDFIDKDGNLKG